MTFEWTQGFERFLRTCSVSTLMLAGTTAVMAQSPPFVSPIFGDSMVLQRDKPNTMWGWSQPGDRVRVEIGDRTATATADAAGKWQVRFQPPATGGPYTLKIAGSQTVEFHDVLVGDVWLCAGQSNMQFGLGEARNAAEEIKNANYPQMRYFVLGQRSAYSKVDVPRGNWRVVSPSTAGGRGGGISAVAYFFARKVQKTTGVPIGLVQVAVGGVPAETFMTEEGLRPLKDFDEGLEEVARRVRERAPEYGNFISHWYDDYDKGVKAQQSWADPALNETGWSPVQVPGRFTELGLSDVPNLSWFRKEIQLPDPLPAGTARVYLGNVEKMDTTFVNGRQVGASSWVENPRVYPVPNGVLKPGRNVIAIRLFKVKPGGGFLGGPESLYLALGDGTKIPLSGEWKGRVSVDGRPPQRLPLGFENNPVMPGILYNGMLAPIAPLSITGAIWYQGESNATRADQYRKLLPAMIADWRHQFGQGEFPFYIVSLPAYKHHSDVPVEDDWAEMREVQAWTAKQVPHSCLAVTIDTGDPDNVHPVDKVQPGERLAACALHEHYKLDVPYSGPILASVERLNGALRLHFDHADGGLVVKGARLAEFSVAGDDRKWHWAEARIEGDTIVVSSKAVLNPKEVRYAWQAFPEAALFNGAGFPAVPFRSDDWPGITVGVVVH